MSDIFKRIQVYSNDPRDTRLHTLIQVMMDVSGLKFMDSDYEEPDNYINIVVNRVFIDVGISHSCFDGKSFDRFHNMCKLAFKNDLLEMYMEDPLPEDQEYAYEHGYNEYYARYSL